jgi:hypothetical protein
MGANGTQVAQLEEWRDRRISGFPTASAFRGTNLGVQGTGIINLRGITTQFQSVDLNIILFPTANVLESKISVWNHLVNDQLDVNWFWREIILP